MKRMNYFLGNKMEIAMERVGRKSLQVVVVMMEECDGRWWVCRASVGKQMHGYGDQVDYPHTLCNLQFLITRGWPGHHC